MSKRKKNKPSILPAPRDIYNQKPERSQITESEMTQARLSLRRMEEKVTRPPKVHPETGLTLSKSELELAKEQLRKLQQI